MILTRILKFFRFSAFCAVVLLVSLANNGCGLIGAGVGTAVRLVPLKLLFQCLPEGTLIDTPEGSQRVEALRPGDEVIGFSGETVKVVQIQGYKEDATVANFLKLEFTDGAMVDLCTQHRVDGTRAGELEVGDELRSGHVVKSITAYGGVERSYDIMTEDKGYRIGGVPVNSMIEEMYEAGHTGRMKE